MPKIKRAKIGRGVFYTRDSGGKHEMTPGKYVEWAKSRADALGVSFDGKPATIERMMRSGESRCGDIFLDYDVKGNLLSRPALNALQAEIERDFSISHVFIPRRDRLARPQNPIDGIQLEQVFLHAGVTIVYQESTVDPIEKGKRADFGGTLKSLFDFEQAGKDRRILAQKIISAQLALAQARFATGGCAPYGFRRWLVSTEGVTVRQLEDGERVRMRGHHVCWLPVPDDHLEMETIRRMRKLLLTTPASQVARLLTAEGVPTPDQDRTRIDNGIRHRTSGVWHATTIVNIARNPLLSAVASYGRRSMGDQLRFSLEGPRELQDDDFREDGAVKVVVNPDHAVCKHPARFKALVDASEQDRLIAELDTRGATQRGKPRSRDPAKNPLGGRLFDMNCGWPMYRVPYNGSFRYTCGAYMQSHGHSCDHNHVDGPMVTRFALETMRQKLLTPRGMEKLRNRLAAFADAERSPTKVDDQLSSHRAELVRLRNEKEQVEGNLARAQNDKQYQAVAKVFEDLADKESDVERKIAELEKHTASTEHPKAEIDSALDRLEQFSDLVADAPNLSVIRDALQLVNLKMFLAFEKCQAGKRALNKMSFGVITFGDRPPPVELYGGPTGRRAIQSSAATVAAGAIEQNNSTHHPLSVGEENSLGNVSRGDGI